MRIADATLDAIRAVEITDIAELAALQQLKRCGGSYLCLCPLHGDRRPSFSIKGNVYNCHAGCGGGDVIDLVMRVHGVPFVEAAQLIAQHVGIALDADPVSLPPRKPRPAPVKREHPPSEAVASIVQRSVPFMAVPDAVAWARGRYLCPELIDYLELARVYERSEGYCVIAPLFDHEGAQRSLVFRSIYDDTESKSKSMWGGTSNGCVFACPFALRLLRGEAMGLLPHERPVVAITEGEIDFITLRERSDATAVFGTRNGAWSPQIAAKIPDGSLVAIVTHRDEPGEKYAMEIMRSLAHRDASLEVARWSL